MVCLQDFLKYIAGELCHFIAKLRTDNLKLEMKMGGFGKDIV